MNSVLELIHEKYASEISVDDLARSLNMSATMFHQHFKDLTATSPLQYVKSLRLPKAKILMVQDGLNASEASKKVARTRALYGMAPEELEELVVSR
jgi:AraC-like DNA-binding protein